MRLGEMLGLMQIVDAKVKVIRVGVEKGLEAKTPLDVTWEDIHEQNVIENHECRMKNQKAK